MRIFFLLLSVLLSLPAVAFAQEASPQNAKRIDLRPVPTYTGQVKIDGFINDWREIPKVEVTSLTRGEPEYDWTGPRDLSMLMQLQADKTHLYLALEVRDNVVAGPRGRGGGDRIELWFDGGIAAADNKNRLRMLEVGIGDIINGGKPKVRWGYPKAWKRSPPKGVKVDGAPRSKGDKIQGYFFEIAIPLDTISTPAPGLEPVGATLIVRDWDYDDPNEDEAAIATSPFDAKKARDPKTMGILKIKSLEETTAGFYKRQPDALRSKPLGEYWIDAGGDGRREYITMRGRHLLLAGQGLGEGDFYYYTLPSSSGHTFQSLEVRDLTGDGKAEMLIKYKIKDPATDVTQEFLAIFHFALDKLILVFQSELANIGEGWEIRNEIKMKQRKGKPTLIEVRVPKKPSKMDPAAYTDVDKNEIVDWDRILLPWQTDQRRTYTWRDGQFLKEQGP